MPYQPNAANLRYRRAERRRHRYDHAAEVSQDTQEMLRRADRLRDYANLPEAQRFSDAGDAALVEMLSGDTLRHVSAWGWLAYHADPTDAKYGVWDKTDGEKLCDRAIEAALYRLACEAAENAGTEAGKRLYSHVHAACNRIPRIRQAAAWRAQLSAQPERFDGALPGITSYLNVRGGVVDLTTGQVYAPQPDYYLTHQANARLTIAPAVLLRAAQGEPAAVAEVTAAAPLWQDFLRTVFVHPNRQPDEALVGWMQKALGYTLTSGTNEQAMLLLYGGGKNGKSTLLNVVAGVLGDYATTIKPEVLVHQGMSYRGEGTPDPELAKLAGVRMVTSVEPSNFGDKGKLDEARVKQMTGKDPLSVRELHKAPFTLTPQFKLFLACNNKPKVEEDTEGIWRRLKLVPFNARFEAGQPGHIPDMEQRLLEQRDGILAWMVVGALRYAREGGLGDPPQSVAEATRAYHRDQAPYSGFFEDEVARDPQGVVLLEAAYRRFEQWFRRNADDLREALGVPEYSRSGWPVDFTLPSKTKFAALCEATNFPKRRRNTGNVLLGMRLLTTEEKAAREAAEDAADAGDAADAAGDAAEDVGEGVESVESVGFTPSTQNTLMRDDIEEICVDPPKATPPTPKATPRQSRHATADEAPVAEAETARVAACPHARLTHPFEDMADGQGEPWLSSRCADCGQSIHCNDNAAHRGQWDAEGCPVCDAPSRAARATSDAAEAAARERARGEPLRREALRTLRAAFALLPTCPGVGHVHDDKRAVCPETNLLVSAETLPDAALVFRYDDAGRVAGLRTTRPGIPFQHEVAAAAAEALGYPLEQVSAEAHDALTAMARRYLAALKQPGGEAQAA